MPKRILDGESIVGNLTLKNFNHKHGPIYYHNYVLEGVKDGDWKLRATGKDSRRMLELFNVSWDPSERVNLINDEKYNQIKTHLVKLLGQFPKGKE